LDKQDGGSLGIEYETEDTRRVEEVGESVNRYRDGTLCLGLP